MSSDKEMKKKAKFAESFHLWRNWNLIAPLTCFCLPILLSLVVSPIDEFLKIFAGGGTLLISAMLLLGLYVEVNSMRIHDDSFNGYDKTIQRANNSHLFALGLILLFSFYKSFTILRPFSVQNKDLRAIYVWSAVLAIALTFASIMFAYKTKKLVYSKLLDGIR